MLGWPSIEGRQTLCFGRNALADVVNASHGFTICHAKLFQAPSFSADWPRRSRIRERLRQRRIAQCVSTVTSLEWLD